MEEMYILHELHGDGFQETESSQDQEYEHEQELALEQPWEEPQAEAVPESITQPEAWEESEPEPPASHNLVFVPIEEPGPNWEMELAQAYVRAQPLESVFPPEEGLRMGTIFPNLSKPYTGRE